MSSTDIIDDLDKKREELTGEVRKEYEKRLQELTGICHDAEQGS